MVNNREERIHAFLKWKRNRIRGIKKDVDDTLMRKIPITKHQGSLITVVKVSDFDDILAVAAECSKFVKENMTSLSAELKTRLECIARENNIDLINHSESLKLEFLNRGLELDSLARSLILYNTIYQANLRDSFVYESMLESYGVKINFYKQKDKVLALNKLVELGYLEEEDISNLRDTFLCTVKEEEKLKRKKIEKPKKEQQSLVEVESQSYLPCHDDPQDRCVNGYDKDVLDAILVDGLRLKGKKYIGGVYIPYRHVLNNALRRNPRLDRNKFDVGIESLVRDSVILSQGPRKEPLYSLNSGYAKSNNRGLIVYIRDLLAK